MVHFKDLNTFEVAYLEAIANTTPLGEHYHNFEGMEPNHTPIDAGLKLENLFDQSTLDHCHAECIGFLSMLACQTYSKDFIAKAPYLYGSIGSWIASQLLIDTTVTPIEYLGAEFWFTRKIFLSRLDPSQWAALAYPRLDAIANGYPTLHAYFDGTHIQVRKSE